MGSIATLFDIFCARARDPWFGSNAVLKDVSGRDAKNWTKLVLNFPYGAQNQRILDREIVKKAKIKNNTQY